MKKPDRGGVLERVVVVVVDKVTGQSDSDRRSMPPSLRAIDVCD